MRVGTLLRGHSTLYGSFGLFTLGSFQCRTAELPWVNNEVGRSCIPLGSYKVIPHRSPTFGQCLWVRGVEDRSEILFHVGNWAAHRDVAWAKSDSLGCILPGSTFALDLAGQPGVTSSRRTLEVLLAEVGRDPFTLNIVDASDLIYLRSALTDD